MQFSKNFLISLQPHCVLVRGNIIIMIYSYCYLESGWQLVHLQYNNSHCRCKTMVSLLLNVFLVAFNFIAGLWSRSSWVLQATNVCLWVTGKTHVFHVKVKSGHPSFHGREPLGSFKCCLHHNLVAGNKDILYNENNS